MKNPQFSGWNQIPQIAFYDAIKKGIGNISMKPTCKCAKEMGVLYLMPEI